MAATGCPDHSSQAEDEFQPEDITKTTCQADGCSEDRLDNYPNIYEKSLQSETPKELYDLCVSRYNINRKILIKNISSSVTLQDIEDFMKGNPVSKIDYEEKSEEAIVVMGPCGNVEERVEDLNKCPLLDAPVTVCLAPSSSLLCVANLPPDFTDHNLSDLADQHGKTQRVFIMRAKSSGKSKGYGFVEYEESSERVRDIVSELDWSEVDGHRVHVEVMEDHLQTWDKMQSRCLLIDNLPSDFLDISKLRQKFSCVTSPVYCQIATKDGKSLGYGVIEFRQVADAEATWAVLGDAEINNTPISLSFCIPGRPAVLVYNHIMLKVDQLEGSAKNSLLPDPLFVSPVLLCSPVIKALTEQFPKLIPTFMKCLKKLHDTYVSSVMSRNTKPGLLGAAPYPAISPIVNPNMQLGLIIFIVLKMQAIQLKEFTGPLAKQLNLLGQLGEKAVSGSKPSLLGEPLTARANMLIQNLHSQLQATIEASLPGGNTEDPNDHFNLDEDSADDESPVMPEDSQSVSEDHPADPYDEVPQPEDTTVEPICDVDSKFEDSVSELEEDQIVTKESPTDLEDVNESKESPAQLESSQTQGLLKSLTGSKTSLLGEPPMMMMGQLSATFGGILNPAGEEAGDAKPDKEVEVFCKQHLQNIKNLNFNLLISLGQLMFSMQNDKPEKQDKDESSSSTFRFNSQSKDGLLPNPGKQSFRRSPGRRGFQRQERKGYLSSHSRYSKPSSRHTRHTLVPRRQGSRDHISGGSWRDDGYNSSLLGEPPSWGPGPAARPSSRPSSRRRGPYDDEYWTGNSYSGDDSGYGEPYDYAYKKPYPQTSATNSSSSGYNTSGTSYNTSGTSYNTSNMGYNTSNFSYTTSNNSYSTNDSGYSSKNNSSNPNASGYSTNSFGTNTSGYNTNTSGYNTNSSGYNTNNTGYNTNNSGFNTNNSGYNTNNSGYNSNNTGYNTNNTGYNTTNTGYNTNNTGYNTNNSGYTTNVSSYSTNNSGYSTNNSSNNTNTLLPSLQNNMYPSNSPSSMSYSGTSGGGLLPFPMGTSTPYQPPPNTNSVMSTPVGQKRSYSALLPEPEPSPEGDFIGQHSQGIGGHYADSYRKRQKLDHRY